MFSRMFLYSMIACLVLMGYDGPKGDSGLLGLKTQKWNVKQEKLKNNTGFLNLFANSASKVEFLSTKLF